jgi:hypothetical protein
MLCPGLLKGIIFILRRGDIVSNLLETYKFCKIRICYMNHGLASRKPKLRSPLDAAHSLGIRRLQLFVDRKCWLISWTTQRQVSLAHYTLSAFRHLPTLGFWVSNIFICCEIDEFWKRQVEAVLEDSDFRGRLEKSCGRRRSEMAPWPSYFCNSSGRVSSFPLSLNWFIVNAYFLAQWWLEYEFRLVSNG